MGAFLVLVVCLVAGALVSRFRQLGDKSHEVLDTYVIYLALPAVALLDLHQAKLSSSLVWAVSLAYILFALAAGLFFGLCKLFKWPLAVFGALLVTSGVGNTSFLGLPMITVFFGSRWKATGIVVDQLGTYLILSTFGILVAALSSGSSRPKPGALAKRVVTFPPFIALCLAFATRPFPYPGWLTSGLGSIGATLAPVALFSIGMQFEVRAESHLRGPVTAGVAAKLVVLPAAVALIAAATVGDQTTVMHVAMFEMAMPAALGGAIVANRYELAQPLPSLLVATGLLGSFVTLPLWSLVLHRL